MPRDVRRNIRLLGWFNFLQDFRPYAPVMVIYFEQITHSYALAMSVLSAVMLASAVFEVPTGVLSDRMGRRLTIVVGALSSMVAVTCYAIGGSYVVLLVGAVFEGLERALCSGNNDALLYDTLVETDERSAYQTHLGRVSSAFQAALAISAAAGGVLAAVSFRLVMWLSVAPKLAMIMVSFRFVEPAVHAAQSPNPFAHLRDALGTMVRNPRLRMVGMGQIIQASVGEAAFQFRTVFIELLWPLWAIGLARTLSNLAAAMSFYFAGNLLQRWGERRLLLGGIAVSQLVNLAALVWASIFSPVIMGATSIFFGVNRVAMNGMLQREFTDAQRSTMGSLTALGGSLSFAVLSVGLGRLADQIGVQYALIVAGLLSSTSIFFFGRAMGRGKPDGQGLQGGK